MLKNEHLNDSLVLRCNSKMLKEFKIKAESLTGKPYTLVVRDIMIALIDDRLSIRPTKEQKNYGGLYNEYRK